MNPTSIHITAVVVRWTTKTGREQKGVATTWLQTKKPIGTFSSPYLFPLPDRFSNFRNLAFVNVREKY